MIKALFLTFSLVFLNYCYAEEYKVYDKSWNYNGKFQKDDGTAKFYDKNYNYTGYS